MSSPAAARRSFLLAGGVGLGAALLLTLALSALLPALEPLALLASLGRSTTIAQLFLMAIGLIAVMEFPIELYVLVQMARRGMGATPLNLFHGAYTFFPAVYGALGAVLTGAGWWLWPMLFLAVARYATSALAINPTEMAARAAQGHRATLSETFLPAERPSPTNGSQPPRGETALRAIQGFILDMDGVLYRGMTVREGAIPFIEYLHERAIPYVCLTNNASRTSEMYQEKLDHLGIPIDAAHVLGAAQATAEWLRAQAAPGARVLPVGEAGLVEELQRAGFTVVGKPPADFVVVGVDFHLTYDKLKQATLAIRANARFIGTNPDSTFPSEEGLLPGNGATLAYLQAATGVEPTIIGKPSAPMMQVALDHLALPARQVAMVGDRLNTDIQGGKNIGVTTVLLLGGVTSEQELAATDLQPDFVYEDLGALLHAHRRVNDRVRV